MRREPELCLLSTPSFPLSIICRSVKPRLPVVRHFPCRSRGRLIFRVPPRLSELLARDHLASPVIVKPGFSRFEAGRDRMSRGMGMLRGVLTGRTIATADVPTFRTAAQMQPPSACRKALHAALAAWRRIRIDSMAFSFHGCLLFLIRCDGARPVVDRPKSIFAQNGAPITVARRPIRHRLAQYGNG
jgi:hypothetical protein